LGIFRKKDQKDVETGQKPNRKSKFPLRGRSSSAVKEERPRPSELSAIYGSNRMHRGPDQSRAIEKTQRSTPSPTTTPTPWGVPKGEEKIQATAEPKEAVKHTERRKQNYPRPSLLNDAFGLLTRVRISPHRRGRKERKRGMRSWRGRWGGYRKPTGQ